MTDISPITQGEQPTGTVGYSKKITSSDYGTGTGDEFSVFVQFPVTFGDEEATALAAADAAFLAKSTVYAQLGLTERQQIVDGVVSVQGTPAEIVLAAFPGATYEATPVAAPVGNAIPAQSTTAAPSAPVATGEPRCPVCTSPLWDNRPKNAQRVAAGQKPLPEGRCKNYADPPKGTGCTGVVWNWEKGV